MWRRHSPAGDHTPVWLAIVLSVPRAVLSRRTTAPTSAVAPRTPPALRDATSTGSGRPGSSPEPACTVRPQPVRSCRLMVDYGCALGTFLCETPYLATNAHNSVVTSGIGFSLPFYFVSPKGKRGRILPSPLNCGIIVSLDDILSYSMRRLSPLSETSCALNRPSSLPKPVHLDESRRTLKLVHQALDNPVIWS